MSEKQSKQQKDTRPEGDIIEGEVIDTTATESPQATQESAEAAATPKPDSEAPASDAPVPATAKNGATWPGKVALVLSLAALGASGYLYWLSMQQTQSSDSLRSSLTQQVESSLAQNSGEVTRSLADMARQLDTMRTQASADKINVEELQLRLTHAMQQVTAQQQASRKDWLLAEVEYLLRLANQRVLMEKTADGALKLLKSADNILKETDDVTIYEVRKALAADIAALEAVPKTDTEGVFLKLGALNAQVNQLKLVPVSEQREIPELLKELTPDTVSESWTAGMKASWNKALDKLNSLIVIQHRDEKIEPLLSPRETFYLQQNLHLMLEQAQMALLQRKQSAYDSSLSKAQQWTGEFFNPKDATTQALIRGIEELKAVQVSPEMPDISGSLNKLKAYLQRMTQLKEEGAA